MSETLPPTPEEFWDKLLSRQMEAVQAAFQMLPPAERQAVMDHLRRMVTEEGWQEAQRISAQFALQALGITSLQL